MSSAHTTDGRRRQPSTSQAEAVEPEKTIPQPPKETEDLQPKEPKQYPFKERADFLIDESLEYQRNGSNPGRILIFNHEIYDDSEVAVRIGSRSDVNEIFNCFSRLGFNFHEDDICHNFTQEEILKKIKSVCDDKEALNEANSLIVFFLSHGQSNDELQVKDTVIHTNTLWKELSKCPQLKDKPKMFIFQACKGNFHSTTEGEPSPFNDNQEPAQLLQNSNFFSNHFQPDMLVVYATIEGNFAIRDPTKGTWFIQELCKNFSSYGRREDVISLITRTIKCVSFNYYAVHNISKQNIKQMPVFVSTLTKKFYLNRYKDRDVLLSVKKDTEDTLKLVKEICAALTIRLE